MTDRPKLTLVATPIGNLGDLSARAIETLASAELWIVEDSRVSGKLQSHLGVKVPMAPLHDQSPPQRAQQLAERIAEERLKAVCITDAGAPAISDPGSALVSACLELGIEIDAIPGPSAVVTALMLSGFYAQRFAFLGFLPRKPGPMRSELASFAESTYTLVMFESPFRIQSLLKVAHEALGPRRYAVCRELTKLHQQVARGRLPEVPDERSMPRKGEMTVVIEGLRRADVSDDGT